MQNRKLKRAPVSFSTHYRAQGIIHSKKFHSLKNNFYEYFKKKKLPIPPTGFLSTNEYHKWQKILYEKNFEKDHYELIKDILGNFGIYPENKEYDDLKIYLVFELCFHETPKPSERETLRWKYIRDPETNEMKMFVEVPTTTRETEWRNFWKYVDNGLKGLPNYRGRNVPWEASERDLELHFLYLEIEKELTNKGIIIKEDKEYIRKFQSVVPIMLENERYKKILNKYQNKGKLKSISDERLYKILSRTKEVFSDLNLL